MPKLKNLIHCLLIIIIILFLSIHLFSNSEIKNNTYITERVIEGYSKFLSSGPDLQKIDYFLIFGMENKISPSMINFFPGGLSRLDIHGGLNLIDYDYYSNLSADILKLKFRYKI